MARRTLSESGYYHITTRTSGKIAMFEDDADRRRYLRALKSARDQIGIRIIAWVLMTDHVHLVIDCGAHPERVSDFMFQVDSPYSRYFNARSGRTGTLFQDAFWSKPILTNEQLLATVHYVHMNPQNAGLGTMQSYRWSSWQEYAGTPSIVDTDTILGLCGSFEAFEAYPGSPRDVIKRSWRSSIQDGDVLAAALRTADVSTSDQLRSLPRERRNAVIRELGNAGASTRKIARAFGIGSATVSRILRAQ